MASKYSGGFVKVGKRLNNSSAYNHDYYIHNKNKWKDTEFSEYSEGDSDFDDENYKEENRLGDTDYFVSTRPDGRQVILEEDMKWVLPKGVKVDKKLIKKLEEVTNASSNKDFVRKTTNAINMFVNDKTINDSKEKFKKETLSHAYYVYNDELYHFGVLGMKWGVRKDRGPSGSRKKPKKPKKESKLKAAARKRRESRDRLTQRINNISKMSDQSVEDRIQRVKNELKLRDLERQLESDKNYDRIIKMAKNTLETVTEKSTEILLTGTVIWAGKKVIERYLGIEAKNSIHW